MDFEIKKIAGIDCIFAPVEEHNSTTIKILIKAGSIYESKKTNGLSHFLEHMFFKGGKKYKNMKEVSEAVDKFGGEFNAYTAKEYAGYYVKCAPEFTHKAIDVLADIMVDANFPSNESEKEKGIIIQEIMMYQDEPIRLVLDKRQRFIFGDNSYGRNTLGPVENIQSFTPEDLFTHKERLYSKDNLIIIIAGKIEDRKKIEDQLDELFQSLPSKNGLAKPKYKRHIPKQKEDFFDKKTEQNHIVISADGFKGQDTERYSAKVLATILGGNMSSRLFQNIREKQGLCYYINSIHHSSPEFGTFIIRAGLEKGRFEFAKKKIFEELDKISNGKIDQEEFDNAIGYLKGHIQMGIESSDQLASFLGLQYLLYGTIETLEDIIKTYEKLTIKDIQKITDKLKNKNLYAYWIQ